VREQQKQCKLEL